MRNHPFPMQFSINFFDLLGILNLKHRPFTDDWRRELERKIKEADSGNWPGAFPRYQSFVNRNGFDCLKKLTEKGANANFILLLFVQYMWVDDSVIPPHESDSPDKKGWEQMLEGIEIAKRATAYFPTDHSTLVLDELSLLETRINERFLMTKDFRKTKKRPPSDKINRVIFTICEHLKFKAGSPHWRQVLQLFRAAGAIQINSPRQIDSPDRHVKPHIASFETDHPKEAEFIRKRLAKEDLPPWFVRP